jgi:DNA repair exonuclease SbcCD ATPase subunit
MKGGQMGTHCSDVFDLFTMLQSDYRMDTLYQAQGTAGLNIYLEPWLLFSINEFDSMCIQDLSYDTSTQEFTADLTNESKVMLAQIMIKFWLQKQIQDVLQMNNNIQDHDFKTYSQAQNLQAKQQAYRDKREEIAQLLNDYAYKHNNWANWELQIYRST